MKIIAETPHSWQKSFFHGDTYWILYVPSFHVYDPEIIKNIEAISLFLAVLQWSTATGSLTSELQIYTICVKNKNKCKPEVGLQRLLWRRYMYMLFENHFFAYLIQYLIGMILKSTQTFFGTNRAARSNKNLSRLSFVVIHTLFRFPWLRHDIQALSCL